jgi:hypothetical protein
LGVFWRSIAPVNGWSGQVTEALVLVALFAVGFGLTFALVRFFVIRESIRRENQIFRKIDEDLDWLLSNSKPMAVPPGKE